MSNSNPMHPESGDRDVEAVLQLFFAAELPEQLPPLPEQVTQTPHVRSRVLPARVAMLVAFAATLMMTVWLGWRTLAVQQSVTVQPRDERAVSGPGYGITNREQSHSGAPMGTWEEDVVAFRWQRSYVDEPYSGERIALNLPRVTVTLPHAIVTTFPVTQ